MPIVKYKNRKLYDLDQHRYVTLSELAEVVRRDVVVGVTEHATGKDITAQVLAEVIYEEEVRCPRLSAEGLARVIRTGVLSGGEGAP